MSIDIQKLEILKKALLNQTQYAKIEVTAIQRDEDENDLFLELFEYACDVDYCYDNYTAKELIDFLKEDDFDSLINELGFNPNKYKGIVDDLIEVAGNNPKVKLTFSKYCCSGFYGEKCRCKRCCTEQNKPYNELDEHRDWVYAQVMQGEGFVIDNVKPKVSFDKDGEMQFGKTFKYVFTGKEVNAG